MSSAPNPEGVPPGAPVVPQGPVPAVGVPNSQDYPRLVYTAPRFEVVAIADIIEPSVLEACEALLPTLVPPYVNQAAIDAVNATAVRRAGDTMTGPLNLSPVIPTANAMAASKQYVDTMVATGTVPEVPPVPAGQAWARQTGQWIPLAGGGTVTNIATGAGLMGGPITATGTISMATMNANTLKGNNTGSVAAPTDIPAGTVLTMIGAAPLNSPVFTGTPVLPTGTTGVTQGPAVNDTTLATTAYVTAAIAAAPAGVQSFNTRTGAVTLALADVTAVGGAPLAGPNFSGNPTAPTPAVGNSSASLATTAFVAGSFAPLASPTFTGTPVVPGYLPLTSGTLSNTLTFSAGQGITYSGSVHRLAFDWDGTSMLAKVDGTATPGAMMPRAGVTDGSSGTAGWVGQYASAINTPGITCNAGVTTDIISLALPAGDWDVEGEAWAAPGGTMTVCQFGLNTVSATIPSLPGDGVARAAMGSTSTLYCATLRSIRISSASSTTVYLSCLPSGAAASGYGMIRARRMR